MDISQIENIPLFSSLSLDEKKSLSELFILRHYHKNTILINEGDDTSSLYLILEGRVKVFLTDESGKEVILNTQTKGEYFGEVSLFDGGPRSASVMTLEDSQFAVLKKQSFIQLITNNPQLSLSIISGLTQRLRALSENVRSLALMDVYGRVARTLMELSVEQENGDRILTETLTYNDMANRIGASSKMVSRIMQDLKKGGYICKESKKIVIKHNLPPAW
jgi:CRP/FNR family cyclic AMP-dependent transcriptional regulator